MQPTLNINFAKTKRLDPRVTFSRASSGTYFDQFGVLKQAVTNQPRFSHDPATGESLGLLMEEARTNLITYSEQFDNAAWAKVGILAFGSGSIANASNAPDGTATMDKIVEDTSTGTHYTQKTYIVTAGVSYTLSFFLKSAERTNAIISIGSAAFTDSIARTAAINLSEKTITSTGGSILGVALQEFPGGIFRASISVLATTSLNTGFTCYIVQTGTTTSYTGDGTSGLYIWGAQLETGSFPTSYIQTVAASATRAADVAQMTGVNFSSWYRQDEGTFSLSATPHSLIGTSDATSRVYFGVGDPTLAFASGETVYFSRNASSVIASLNVIDGGVAQVANISGSLSTTAFNDSFCLSFNSISAMARRWSRMLDSSCMASSRKRTTVAGSVCNCAKTFAGSFVPVALLTSATPAATAPGTLPVSNDPTSAAPDPALSLSHVPTPLQSIMLLLSLAAIWRCDCATL